MPAFPDVLEAPHNQRERPPHGLPEYLPLGELAGEFEGLSPYLAEAARRLKDDPSNRQVGGVVQHRTVKALAVLQELGAELRPSEIARVRQTLTPSEYLAPGATYRIAELPAMLNVGERALCGVLGVELFGRDGSHVTPGAAPAIARRQDEEISGAAVIEAIEDGRLEVFPSREVVESVMRRRARAAAAAERQAAREAEAAAREQTLAARVARVVAGEKAADEADKQAERRGWIQQYRDILQRSLAGKEQPEDVERLATCITCLEIDPAQVEADLRALAEVAELDELATRTEEARAEVEAATEAIREMEDRHKREVKEATARRHAAWRFAHQVGAAKDRAAKLRDRHPLVFGA